MDAVRIHHDSDILSAVEWLKEEDYKIYQEIGKLLKDVHPGVVAKVGAKIIKLQNNRNKAFEDVTKRVDE